MVCGTVSNNLVTSSSNIFLNYVSKDFHIVSTIGNGYPRNAGTDLSQYLTKDINGIPFTTWDIGANAYNGKRPAAPSNLMIK